MSRVCGYAGCNDPAHDHDRAADFLAALPWADPSCEWPTLEWRWQGTSGVAALDDDRRVTVELVTTGHVGHYVGVRATIGSKYHGEIIAKTFLFADHLHGRVDHRHDWRGGFEVVSSVGWSWYIAVPAHPETLTQAVEAWIGEWL